MIAFTGKPKFRLGQVVSTPGALNALSQSGSDPAVLLGRHQAGNWGDLCDDDKRLNEDAIKHEGDWDRQQRVFSAYKIGDETTIWIITEWDRSITTLLLPEEY